MKFPFKIADCRMPIEKKSAWNAASSRRAGLAVTHHSSLVTRHSSGMALVITLIMLSVTLVMVVAFLAVSRRERASVTTGAEGTTARLAAETALAAAQSQILANILSSGNGSFNSRLVVSTNYINGTYGFNPNLAGVYPTNVNYDFKSDNTAFTVDEWKQNIANLQFLPRAPVIMSNNVSHIVENRFYLDLNRNGVFEDTGDNVPNVFIDPSNGNSFTNGNTQEIGDPQWIGILERPDTTHSPDNKFISRYAYVVLPVGNSLDINYIHNQTFNPNLVSSDGFFRNEGVGSWELNMAAFLADLNTNQWDPPTIVNPVNNPYGYQQPAFPNGGAAFEDARAFLAWRYGYNYNSQAIPSASMYAGLVNAGIDGYTIGNLMTNTALPSVLVPVNQHWAGSDNTNHFFSLPADLFDAQKSSTAFTNRLRQASASNLTYDRYTFNRMLDQLSTDSTSDDTRMNLNYKNVTNRLVVAGMETNMISWTALDFFTNAADRLLLAQTAKWRSQNFNFYTNTFGATITTAFGVDKIPVYVNDQFVYTPAINRLLQVAANIFDASTNKTFALGKDYPSVFRPVFLMTNENGFRNVYINNFREVSALSSVTAGTAPLDAPVDVTSPGLLADANVTAANGNAYGVPWIIGAKKGLPGFNEFSMLNAVQVTRKLQVSRTDALKPGATATNQMFIMSITNHFGFSFWNSYNTNYLGNLSVYFSDIISMTLTNDGPKTWQSFYGNPALVQFTFPTVPNSFPAWPGSQWTSSGFTAPELQTADNASFISKSFDFAFLPESIYRASLNDFERVSATPALWETNYASVPVFPHFGLMTTNRLQAYILDDGHVLDYVQLAGPNSSQDFNDKNTGLIDNDPRGSGNLYWSTNAYGVSNPLNTPTRGVVNQITVSENPTLAGITWKPPSDMPLALNTPKLEGDYFKAFFFGGSVSTGGKLYSNTNLIIQVPYTPSRSFWNYTLWQANDPLVHYIASDLNTLTRETGQHRDDALPASTLGSVGERYQPWGRNQQMAVLGETSVDTNSYNLRFRDPLVWGSDYWDFPAGKYPSVGWLGRVHRGTPWQTVYLKQRDVLQETFPSIPDPINIGTNTWAQWTGNRQNNFDAANSVPVHDGDLFDLFTAQINGNASRGALPVNQTHLAAWSALFSGLVALTNITDFPAHDVVPVVTNLVIDPAGLNGNNSAVGFLVNGTQGINNTRLTFTNADGVVGVFEHVGDILRVPAFTEQSPFLNHTDSDRLSYDISDELYEWLPQQTLGLLRISQPRFVIYCYGQTLRPAPDGTVLGGSYFGMVTNYQVAAESASRAVISVQPKVTTSGGVTVTNYTTKVESFNVLPPE